MKKTSLKQIIKITILLLIIIDCLHVITVQNQVIKDIIKGRTEDYIILKGYPIEMISKIDIKHSYINRILGYDEWKIKAGFNELPNIDFLFRYHNDEITFEGVVSEPPLDKDQTIQLYEWFENGNILSE